MVKNIYILNIMGARDKYTILRTCEEKTASYHESNKDIQVQLRVRCPFLSEAPFA